MFLRRFTTGAAAASYTHQINFLPEFLMFFDHNAIAPVANPTDIDVPTVLRVSVAGDGIVGDYNADAVRAASELKTQKSPLASGFAIVPLADGIIRNKVVDIDLQFGINTDVSMFAISKNEGTMYLRCLRQTILANSGQDISKFLAFMLSTYADADVVTIEYATGVRHTSHVKELIAMENFNTNELDNYNTLMVTNLDQSYSKVNYIPSAQRSLFLWRFEAPKSLDTVQV